jgi:hypothetical protein
MTLESNGLSIAFALLGEFGGCLPETIRLGFIIWILYF